MRLSPASLALAGLILLQAPLIRGQPHENRALKAITALERSGALAPEKAMLLRLTLVAQPQALPPDLRDMALASPLPCGTPVVTQVARFLQDHPNVNRAPFDALLFPRIGDGYVASDRLPLEVRFTSPLQEALALQTLAYAEEAWDAMVTSMGFYAPYRAEDYQMGQVITLGSTLSMGALGYTSPTSFRSTTAHCDCYTTIVVDSRNGPDVMPYVVTHELTHACQMAMDCSEALSFMEQTAEAITLTIHPDDYMINYPSLQVFQSMPHHCLDWYRQDWSNGYEYGGGIWPLFLDQRFGQGDGVLIRRLWEETMQEGTTNEPDYMDGLARVVAPEGESWPLTKVFREFSDWRYLLGNRDDGAHFDQGHRWRGAEVETMARLGLDDLPTTLTPYHLPEELGVSYVHLDTDEAWDSDALAVRLEGDGAVRWGLRAILWRGNDTPAVVQEFDVADYVVAEGRVEGLGQAQEVVLVVTNLTDGFHDPDLEEWEGASFQLDMAFEPGPAIEGVEPSSKPQGATNAGVVLRGRGFVEAMTVEILPDVEVTGTDVITSGQAEITLTIPATAPPGPRDMVVTVPSGLTFTLPGGFTVTDAGPPALRAVLPTTLSPGDRAILTVTGSNFVTGLGARFLGDDVVVEEVRWVSYGEVEMTVVVPEGASPGPVDLEVTNPNGLSALLLEAVTIAGQADGGAPDGDKGHRDGGAAEDEGDAVAPGCGCSLL